MEETVTGFDAAGVNTLTGAAFTGTLTDTLEFGALTGAFTATLGLAFETTLGAGLETDLPVVLAAVFDAGLGTGDLATGFCTSALDLTPV